MTHRVDARALAGLQREISVSEFFARNRHLLGLDTPARALLTAVKEAVDNALDACEEAGILPEIRIDIAPRGERAYLVTVEDNGPGIVEDQVGRIFGKLLYGSKFHELRQSRGQHGMGIAAAGMYGQLTTGQPTKISTRTGKSRPAWEFLLSLDTTKNRPIVHRRQRTDWTIAHGTRVEIELEGQVQRGPHSVAEFVRQTAIANPHATLVFEGPDGERIVHRRTVRARPPRPRPMRPHPHGIDLGTLVSMTTRTRCRTLATFLQREFSRVGPTTASAILRRAGLSRRAATTPRGLTHAQAAALHRAFGATRISAPSAACLVPIGEDVVRKSLEARLAASFCTAVTRPPAVYRGHPFQVEVGLAFGHGGAVDEDRADASATVLRFANRVPLLYQAGACATTQAVVATSWRRYGLQQSHGALPTGPVAILLHVASVWVPFTSESKDAIADDPEIARELRLALQECGRRLAHHLAHVRHAREENERRDRIASYVPHIAAALQEILGLDDEVRDGLVSRLDATIDRRRSEAA
jgi:DNA topoisomerase-6 subunit B